jgi:hypothetical protein
MCKQRKRSSLYTDEYRYMFVYLASRTDNTINNNKKIEILFGNSNVISAELRFFLNSKKRIDTCMNYTRPQMAIVLEPMKKAFVDAKTKV